MAAPKYIRPQRHNSWFAICTEKEFKHAESNRFPFLDSFVTLEKIDNDFIAKFEGKETLNLVIRYGFICVWFGDNLDEPDWEFPQLFDEEFEKEFVIVKPRLFENTNLLDLIENNGDPIHFKTVHHWLEVKLSDHEYTPLKYSLTMQGKVKYAQSADSAFKRFISRFLPVNEYTQRLAFHGPGFGSGQIHVQPDLKAQLILAFLPLGENDLRLHVAARVDENTLPGWLRFIFNLIPLVSLHDLLSWAFAKAGRDDTDGDYRIWHTKRSLKNPRLLPGEDNITKIRDWMAQYYPKDFKQPEQTQKTEADKSWQYLCNDTDLDEQKISSFKIAEEELIAYKDSSGAIRVFEAHCPHQGAHLGVGGELKDDCIACPFHKFYFNPEGKYVGAKPNGESKFDMHLNTVAHRINDKGIEVFV